jgi:hypothetical protein
MTKDEALKLALEALEANHFLIHGSETKGGLAFCMDGYYSGCFDIDSNDKQTNEAITAIKEALAQPEQEPVAFAKIFTQLKTDDEPCNEVIALGHMMRDWLQKQVSDNSSYVDTGKGFSEYNLWVMCEGKELLISIKESK